MNLGDFGQDGGRKRFVDKTIKQLSSPNKKQVVDPGRVQVEIVCERYGVGAKCQFGANKLRDDLNRVRVPGWSNGLGWNVEGKMYMNAYRHDRTKITCPSLEFLKLLCHACENSAWCSHFYLTDRHGKSIPCNATPGHPNYIEDLDVEFDTRPDTPEPEVTPEPEFTCDDVRRDIRKILKVPRRIGKIASEMRVLSRKHRAMMTETEAIVTTFLGAYGNRNE